MATLYSIERDIKVLCVTASSFPAGVQDAHKKLHSIIPSPAQRTFYGISYSDRHGNVIYKAAAEASGEGEAESLNVESFTIRKGRYISEVLVDWRKDEALVGKTFRRLLSDPRIDKNGYCLEIYLNDSDMRCMVPLDALHSQVTLGRRQSKSN